MFLRENGRRGDQATSSKASTEPRAAAAPISGCMEQLPHALAQEYGVQLGRRAEEDDDKGIEATLLIMESGRSEIWGIR